MENETRQNHVSEIAFDLGTVNSVVVAGGNVLVDVPSWLGIEMEIKGPKVCCKWDEARNMKGRNISTVKIIQPMKNDNIFYNSVELLVSELLLEAKKKCSISAETKIGIGIPLDFTYGDRLVFREAFKNLGCNNVYLIPSIFAVAIAQGLNVNNVLGKMIIEIGGGKTQIAVICMGGIVVCESIPIGGEAFTAAIQEGLRINHNIKVSECTAEGIKRTSGMALVDMENPQAYYVVSGAHIVTAEQIEVKLSPNEIAEWLHEPLTKIENAVSNVLERVPPELFNDFAVDGIWLSGGGAMLYGLAERLSRKTKIKVKLVDETFYSVAQGVEMALKNLEENQFIIKL